MTSECLFVQTASEKVKSRLDPFFIPFSDTTKIIMDQALVQALNEFGMIFGGFEKNTGTIETTSTDLISLVNPVIWKIKICSQASECSRFYRRITGFSRNKKIGISAADQNLFQNFSNPNILIYHLEQVGKDCYCYMHRNEDHSG